MFKIIYITIFIFDFFLNKILRGIIKTKNTKIIANSINYLWLNINQDVAKKIKKLVNPIKKLYKSAIIKNNISLIFL